MRKYFQFFDVETLKNNGVVRMVNQISTGTVCWPIVYAKTKHLILDENKCMLNLYSNTTGLLLESQRRTYYPHWFPSNIGEFIEEEE